MAEVTIGESAAGQTITLARGDQLIIELPEIPSSGFRWRWTPGTGDILALQVQSNRPGAEGIGGSVIRVFHFAATASGSARIRLELARSWQTEPPRSTFEVGIQVT